MAWPRAGLQALLAMSDHAPGELCWSYEVLAVTSGVGQLCQPCAAGSEEPSGKEGHKQARRPGLCLEDPSGEG